MMSKSSDNTFWGHVEIFRWALIRCFLVIFAIAIAAFVFKGFVFGEVILAPTKDDFATYRFLCCLSERLVLPSLCPRIQSIEMININLTAQLFTHISMSFYIGLIVAFPYLMMEIWGFVSPALFERERKPAIIGSIAFLFLFYIGILIAYFVIFPLTLNFLGTYQVSESVINQISLSSYISTFLGLIVMLGLVFEMPIVAYFFAKIGVLSNEFLSRYRKVAVVIVMICAALITPSTDIFTMMLVAVPLYLLFEFSRFVVKKVEKKKGIVVEEEMKSE